MLKRTYRYLTLGYVFYMKRVFAFALYVVVTKPRWTFDSTVTLKMQTNLALQKKYTNQNRIDTKSREFARPTKTNVEIVCPMNELERSPYS